MYYPKKKPWKNFRNYISKATKNYFSCFKNVSLTCNKNSSTFSKLSDPKYDSSPIRSQCESSKFKDKCMQHEKRGIGESNKTEILLTPDREHAYRFEHGEKAQRFDETGPSMNDVYAQIMARNPVDGTVDEIEDVDERAEKFIKEFRQYLRIRRLLSEEEKHARDDEPLERYE